MTTNFNIVASFHKVKCPSMNIDVIASNYCMYLLKNIHINLINQSLIIQVM
jgi:hypothetical protein